MACIPFRLLGSGHNPRAEGARNKAMQHIDVAGLRSVYFDAAVYDTCTMGQSFGEFCEHIKNTE